jgi:adenosylhomocysteine nucleosidase
MGPSTLSESAEQKTNLNRLGIIVAMRAEALTLVKQPITSGELVYLPEGPIIQVSGIGPQKASLTAKTLLEKGAKALLSWGSAGGLIPMLSPGSLVLPKIVIASDESIYDTDAIWHERLCNRLGGHVDLHQGPLAESATILNNQEEKVILYRQNEAIAVDMESGAIAKVAHDSGIPFMAIRAVADPIYASTPRILITALDEFGELDLLSLMKGLIRYPLELFPLVQMARNFRIAKMTLTSIVHLTGTNFLFSQ